MHLNVAFLLLLFFGVRLALHAPQRAEFQLPVYSRETVIEALRQQVWPPGPPQKFAGDS